jgi:GAF domain-containing protein
VLLGQSEQRASESTIQEAESRDALALLVAEQAALRRVATLVARESSPGEMRCEAVGPLRFEPDETATLVVQSDTPWNPPPLGTRFPLDGENVVAQLLRTGRVARVDDWTGATGSIAAMASVLGVRSTVAAPVIVKGSLWGSIIAASSQSQPLPAEAESRVEQFTGLVATAIDNADARGALSRLAEEQAALRRVAVLVAQQHPLGADLSAIHVFRGDGVATVVASWSEAGPTLAIETELALDGDAVVARVFHNEDSWPTPAVGS